MWDHMVVVWVMGPMVWVMGSYGVGYGVLCCGSYVVGCIFGSYGLGCMVWLFENYYYLWCTLNLNKEK